MRGDEVFGYFFSLPSLAEIVRSTLSLAEPHPVASYFLQKGWLGLAGHSEFALRFVSAWSGALAVALIYRLGRRLRLGPATSTLAAALLAISPYAIWHSQDARMYSISLALTLASTVLALLVSPELAEGEALARRRWFCWLAYVVVSWLALQTHYFAVFVLLAQNAAVLLLALVRPDWRRQPCHSPWTQPSAGLREVCRRISIGRWLLGQVLLSLLYLPWLLVAAETLTGYRGNGDSPGFAAMLVRAASVFAVGETIPGEQRTGIALLAGLLLLISAARLIRSGLAGRQTLLWLSLYLALPLLATWFSALSRPIFNERYLIAATPPFFLLLAVALLGLPGTAKTKSTAGNGRRQIDDLAGWAAAALLALLLFSSAASLNRYYRDPAYSKTRGWRDLAATLERFSSGLPPEQVRLVQNFPDPTLWYYYAGPVAHLVLPPAAHDAGRTAQEVRALVDAGVQRVVLPLQPADNWDDAGLAAAALSQEFDLLAESQVAGWPVQIYSRPPADWMQKDVNYANGLLLAEIAVPGPLIQPGDVLPVYLRWQGSPDLLSGAEKLTLQLLDATGRLVAQFDQPFGQAQIQAPGDPDPLQLPLMMSPGSYQLIMALYDPGQEGAPRLLTASGADTVELGVLELR